MPIEEEAFPSLPGWTLVPIAYARHLSRRSPNPWSHVTDRGEVTDPKAETAAFSSLLPLK